MGNINLPTPVALAGAALCLLGGYLVGAVLGPDTAERTTAEVDSYDPRTRELCLAGDAVADAPEADDGVLCGTWQRNQGAQDPRPGDRFRFVVMTTGGDSPEETETYLYGDVVR